MMIIQNQEKTFEQKVQEAKQISFQESQVDLTKPYMKNMNEDPLLNARISYSLANEYTYVGRQTGNPVPQIIINVGGIQENHAVFHYTEDRIFLKPMNVRNAARVRTLWPPLFTSISAFALSASFVNLNLRNRSCHPRTCF